MPKADSPKVEKAINELNQFLQTMEIQTTRNGNAFTVDDVQYVTRNMSTTRSAFEVENNVLPDTILYLVNFGDETDNSGYAVLDATERSGAIILAVVENGYVSPEDFLFDTTPVDGYKKYTRYSNGEQQNKYYMHCCWGWMRGQCNGYYLSKVFDLRNGAIELENKDTPGTKERDYDMLYRMITYDKPNQ